LDTLKIKLKNHSMLTIDCEPSVRHELSEFFSFYVPGYKFMPAYRNRIWDGKIRMYNGMNGEINAGLYHKIKYFAADRNYGIELEETDYGIPFVKNKVNHQQVVKFIDSLNLPFEMRDYQYEAFCHGIENKRAVLVSPTGSGKSLIIYAILRWYLEYYNKKLLIIVPTTGLVEQMYNDFKDYGYASEDNCHIIYSGKDKVTNKPVIISTWQSIHKLRPEWFKQFGCIIGDECHGFKAKSLSSIMNKATEAEYRFGTTGTLDGTQTHKLVLEGLFGPVKKVITTKQLQEKDALADLQIDLLVLKYSAGEGRDNAKRKYQDEIDFIVRHEERNKFIRNLALTRTGNTLVLFQFVEKHGEKLFTMIREKGENVYYVHGGTDTSDRESIRGIVESKKNAIIVASYGTFSTGINIRNLHNIIFASPCKSQIKVLQSIGRGLRKSDDGRTTVLYDIIDDLHWKGTKNFALKHSEERAKIYANEQFKFDLHEVEL